MPYNRPYATEKQIQYANVLLKKNGLIEQTAQLCHEFEPGALRPEEMHVGPLCQLIAFLKGDVSSDLMRKKIISMAHELRWLERDNPRTVDMSRIDRWCDQYSYLAKPLMEYSQSELPRLVTQFQEMYFKEVMKVYPR